MGGKRGMSTLLSDLEGTTNHLTRGTTPTPLSAFLLPHCRSKCSFKIAAPPSFNYHVRYMSSLTKNVQKGVLIIKQRPKECRLVKSSSRHIFNTTVYSHGYRVHHHHLHHRHHQPSPTRTPSHPFSIPMSLKKWRSPPSARRSSSHDQACVFLITSGRAAALSVLGTRFDRPKTIQSRH